MSTPVLFNGVVYNVPAFNDVGYAQGPGNMSAYWIALAGGTLQPTGGTFPLLADINFGLTFGLIAAYFTSVSATPATAGSIRMANTDTINWRNFTNTGNLPLGVNVANQLTFNGVILSTPAINGTVNTGIANTLAYYPASTNTVDDLPAITALRALESNASGLPIASATTAAELGYVSGVTSAIQTQINTKAADVNVVHLTGNESIAGIKTFTTQLIGKGTATNDNAAAGYIGEIIESTAGPVAGPASGDYADLTSISLTAGDWDVSLISVADFVSGVVTTCNVGIGTTSGNSSAGLVLGSNQADFIGPNTTSNVTGTVPPYRISIAGTTTYYFKIRANFTVGAPNFRGRISARRVR